MLKKRAERELGREFQNRTGKSKFLLSRVPPGPSSSRRGRTRRVRRVRDIYCFKLSPLLSSPCQEVFEDRKYSGDFVSGVNRNLWVTSEFKARFSVPTLAGVRPGDTGPFRSSRGPPGPRRGTNCQERGDAEKRESVLL